MSDMTEDDLVTALDGLLERGLIMIDADQLDSWDEDPAAVPRFYLTQRGRAELACDHKFVDSVACLKCGWTPAVFEVPA